MTRIKTLFGTLSVASGLAASLAGGAAAQTGSFQTLIVQPVNPTTGQPAGKLTFDHTGLVIEGHNGVTPDLFGKMLFSGNELTLIGVGDPPKVRLASENNGGAVSFNKLRPDGVQEEVFLVTGGLDEQDPSSLGGQLKIFVRRRDMDGDAAMRLMGVISAAYTDDGQPRVRWHPNTVHDLEEFTEPTPGVIGELTTLQNLSGTLAAAQAEDGQWLVAGNVNLDTGVQAPMHIDSSISQLRIQLRRTTSGGTQPYVYVEVNGIRVVDQYRPSSTVSDIVVVPVSGSGQITIRVLVSAQTGTVEVGSIRGI